MGRSRRCIVLLLAAVSLFAYGASAQTGDPEPLALSVSSARETCTRGSVTTLDYTIDGGVPPYQLVVDGRPIEDLTEPNYVSCQSSTLWTPLRRPDDEGIQRILVSVRDAAGSRAYGVAEHRLVRPLPAPNHLQATSGLTGSREVNLSARWEIPYVPRAQRTEDFAIRWRVVGSSEWRVEHHRGKQKQAPVFSFRDTWMIDAPPGGERREVQVAQLRHIYDLQAPKALLWSESALVTTAAAPRHLQAEATHDTITLGWGPHAPGLAYRAELHLERDRGTTYVQRLRLDTGPMFQAHFPDLLPDTLYRVKVYLEDGDRRDLDQKSFVLRTEPAPQGWSPPSRSPTDISAIAAESTVEVSWTPAETGARHDTIVCAYPTEDRWKEACAWVKQGQARAHLSLAKLGEGGTFQINIETLTTPPGSAQTTLHVPTYQPNLPTRGGPATAPRFAGVSWHGPTQDSGAVGHWRIEWDQGDARLAEISWRQHDRAILRESTSGSFWIDLPAGQAPVGVRIRLLNERGWTEWSDPADFPSVTEPMFFPSLRIDGRESRLEVRWHAASEDTDVIGYRVYLARNHGKEEILDVGNQTSATFPIEPGDRNYEASVAPLTAAFGELARSWTDWYVLDSIGLDLRWSSSQCSFAAQATMSVRWMINGGAPPFLVSIGNLLAFETEEYSGRTEVDCVATADGNMQDIVGTVTDARGLTAVDTIRPRAPSNPSTGSELEQVSIELGPRSVHRDHVLLSWDCRSRPNVAVLRWRLAGHDAWTYAPDFPQHREPRDQHGRCRGSLDGLEPLTTYEYQLAKYGQTGEFQYPEHLLWTESQTVTTLGPPQELSIERAGETVSVSWQRQPEASAYLVGLRAEGRSWWRRYDPSGMSTETLHFYRVPGDLELRVELISPPEIPREYLPSLLATGD